MNKAMINLLKRQVADGVCLLVEGIGKKETMKILYEVKKAIEGDKDESKNETRTEGN